MVTLAKLERDYYSSLFQKGRGNWGPGIKNKVRAKKLTGASPGTIPETIAERSSAPFPFSFLKWRCHSDLGIPTFWASPLS